MTTSTNTNGIYKIRETYPTANYLRVAEAYTADGWEAWDTRTLAEAIERGATHLSLEIWDADWKKIARADFSVAELNLNDLKPRIPAGLGY